MANALVLEAPSRLHFGLVDLGGVTRRSFGGVGCFIGFPSTTVKFLPTRSRLGLSVSTGSSVDSDVSGAIDALLSYFPHAVGDVEIVEAPFAHSGFGSKTAAVLGVLKCAAIGNGLNIPDEELKRISRRGGASGVGVHGFFEGGLIVDCGHDARPSGPWLPSSAYEISGLPLKVARITVPDGWRFHLMMPRGELISGEKERAFFAFHTPIAAEQVLESLAAVWHGVVPAFLEADLNLLRLALKDLSSCGLKKQEIEAQSESRRLIDLIAAELALPVGMSSLGPLVFCVSEASMDVTPRLRAICDKCDAMYIGAASPANHGFLVS